jgi:hypothetical protein
MRVKRAMHGKQARNPMTPAVKDSALLALAQISGLRLPVRKWPESTYPFPNALAL